jgi:membrane associated rhomboid family serine protease
MTKQGINLMILVIAIMVLSMSMFLLWPNRDSFFWTTYAFSVIAILGVAGNTAYMKSNNKQFASNLAPLTISIIYLVINILCSVLFLMALKVGNTVYLVAHMVIFAVFLIIWLLGIIAVRHINEQDR